MKQIMQTLVERLRALDIHFTSKPLIIGGLAMKYYGLEKSEKRYGFVIPQQDYERLSTRFSNAKMDNWGDLSVVIENMVFWRSINLLDYEYLKKDAVPVEPFLVVSIDRLLLLSSLIMNHEHQRRDYELIIEYIFDKYQNPDYVEYANEHLTSYYQSSGAVYNGQYKKDK